MNSPSFRRALPICLAAGAVIAAVPMVGSQGARPAEASCLAPRFAFVREVRVTRCEVVDPRAQPQVRNLADSMALNRNNPDEIQRFLDSYRGVVLDGVVVRSVRRPVNARPPARSLSAYPIGGGGANLTYFRPTLDANACNAITNGRTISVYELASCCDGDPGVPCLLRGGTAPAPHAATP